MLLLPEICGKIRNTLQNYMCILYIYDVCTCTVSMDQMRHQQWSQPHRNCPEPHSPWLLPHKLLHSLHCSLLSSKGTMKLCLEDSLGAEHAWSHCEHSSWLDTHTLDNRNQKWSPLYNQELEVGSSAGDKWYLHGSRSRSHKGDKVDKASHGTNMDQGYFSRDI